jgi:uridine kinase
MTMSFDALVREVMARPGPVRLVAVDGHGGAGKSTFAARLSRHAGGAPVVPTDDFASWDEPIDWWPRLLTEVVEPIVAGEEGGYRRYDWIERRLAEWITVPRRPIVVIEGVSAGRREWSEHLAYTVFVATPEPTRLRRGLDRDGKFMLGEWRSWMAAEDAHFERDGVLDRAALVIDGEPPVAHEPDEEFVVIRRGDSGPVE